jgi:CBS domain-containing protein
MEERIMIVREVMTANVECIRPGDTLRTAAVKMRDLNVGALPVCGENDRLAGMLTDRDIIVRAIAGSADPATTQVRQVMTPEVVYCFDDDDISEAALLMEQHQIRRLIVLDQQKRLVGILSLGDLAVKAGDDQLSGEALEQVSEPAAPRR